MKIKVALVFLLSCLFLAADAQKKDPSEKESLLRFGFKAGLNLDKIEGKSFKDEFKYNYQLGAFMQLNLTRKLGLQPELSFAQTSAEQSSDITVIYDDLFLEGTQKKAKLNYVKLAGLLNIDIGPSQRVKLQLGPQWGMLVSEVVDSVKTTKDIFKKGELSVLGGIMLQLPLFHVGTRYEIGLTNINDIDNQDMWKRQTWQFFLGVTL